MNYWLQNVLSQGCDAAQAQGEGEGGRRHWPLCSCECSHPVSLVLLWDLNSHVAVIARVSQPFFCFNQWFIGFSLFCRSEECFRRVGT